MSSPLPDINAYWAQLSASNPAVQALEGTGTHPQLDEPKTQAFHYSQQRGSSFKPDL